MEKATARPHAVLLAYALKIIVLGVEVANTFSITDFSGRRRGFMSVDSSPEMLFVDTVTCPFSITVPDFPSSTCGGNAYFIDFGSTGMKIFRAHKFENQSDQALETQIEPASLDLVKVEGLPATTPPCVIEEILDTLLKRVKTESDGDGAVLATSGMRLAPKHAQKIFEAVRGWADEHPGMFARCGVDSNNEDCATLAGAEEATYEMRAMLASSDDRAYLRVGGDNSTYGRSGADHHFGFASCGGGSMQLGISGAEPELNRCHQDLGQLVADMDTERVAVRQVDGAPALVLSFLSSHDPHHRPCETLAGGRHVCDYRVGGLNEMRANFDNFLVSKGHEDNPCLSPFTVLKQYEVCSLFGVTSCVADRYGGYVSALAPTNASLQGAERAQTCRDLVRDFVDGDLMLSRWAASSACKGLAGGAARWGLLSAYTRLSEVMASPTSKATAEDIQNEQGIDFTHKVSFALVREVAAQEESFASEAEVERGEKLGAYIDLALLVRIFEVLGVSDPAVLRGSSVKWAHEAMLERGLAPGWLASDSAGACSARSPGSRSKSHRMSALGVVPVVSGLLGYVHVTAA